MKASALSETSCSSAILANICAITDQVLRLPDGVKKDYPRTLFFFKVLSPQISAKSLLFHIPSA